MNYPLEFTFKLLALASQIYIRDAGGNLLGYAKQKMFKFKEDVRIFADEAQTQELYQIKADRVIDFSARYNFIESSSGRTLGSIKRRGMRSIWRAHYEIFDGDRVVKEIKEESAMVKIFDGLIGEIPIIGAFTGYFFNPAYLATDMRGAVIARLQKQPAFFEGKFQLQQQGQMSDIDEQRIVLGFLMMTLLERSRG
jgi:hypothetical protein